MIYNFFYIYNILKKLLLLLYMHLVLVSWFLSDAKNRDFEPGSLVFGFFTTGTGTGSPIFWFLGFLVLVLVFRFFFTPLVRWVCGGAINFDGVT
jgi:hypothetical protein